MGSAADGGVPSAASRVVEIREVPSCLQDFLFSGKNGGCLWTLGHGMEFMTQTLRDIAIGKKK